MNRISKQQDQSMPYSDEELAPRLAVYLQDKINVVAYYASDGHNNPLYHFTIPMDKYMDASFTYASRLEVAEQLARSLWKHKKYAKLHVDYLEGSIGEDEFFEQAKDFSSNPRSISTEKLQLEYETAVKILREKSLQMDDLALVLDLNPMEVLSTVQSLEQLA